MEETVVFFSKEIELELTLSIGEYTRFDDDEEPLFYIGLSDDDDLCYQYEGLSFDVVKEVFEEIKDKVHQDDFYSKVFPNTCELYGLVRN